jgi:hypothetical protein
MKKLKISFEISDNWSRDEFRQLMGNLFIQPETVNSSLSVDNVELFIISNDDSTAYIHKVGIQLGLESDHVIVCNFTDDKIDAIKQYGIDIHFDDLEPTVLRVYEETEAECILVNNIPNRYDMTFDYIVKFNNILKRLANEESQKSC